jgi:4-hydroxymandelate oxidase
VIDHELLRQRAQELLPDDVFDYFAAGAGAEVTLAREARAWDEVMLQPRVLRDVSETTVATSLLGRPVASPVIVAPMASQRLAHASGEVGTAIAARDAGALMVLSMRSSTRVEDVGAVGPFWQQLYVLQDRGITDEVVERARAAGALALVVTVDTPIVASKRVGLPATLPPLGLVSPLDRRDVTDERLQQARDVGPRDLERLAERSGLPVVAKGVLSAQAARDCVAAGASAVIVSTHGGRQLDGVVPTPVALPAVVDAVGAEVEVYADGGLRTGSHVLAALALGARAVLVGRPVLWALATGGSDGVRHLLDDFREQVREALALGGCRSCADVGPDLVHSLVDSWGR